MAGLHPPDPDARPKDLPVIEVFHDSVAGLHPPDPDAGPKDLRESSIGYHMTFVVWVRPEDTDHSVLGWVTNMGEG